MHSMCKYVLFSILFYACMYAVGMQQAHAQSGDGSVIQVIVQGCNNNGICEPLQGEDASFCPLDCTVATTTPTTTPPEPERDARQGGDRRRDDFVGVPLPPVGETRSQLREVTVDADKHSITVSWKTEEPTLGVLFWGKRPDFEAGAISQNIFTNQSVIHIPNVEEGTVYYLQIMIRTLSGYIEFSPLIKVRTTSVETTRDVLPSDVRMVMVGRGDTDQHIRLSWTNPPSDQFSYVRVVQKIGEFPNDPFDGTIIYEGRGVSVSDIVSKDAKTYYGIFVRDRNGNYSRGAFAQVQPRETPGGVVVPSLDGATDFDYTKFSTVACYDIVRSKCDICQPLATEDAQAERMYTYVIRYVLKLFQDPVSALLSFVGVLLITYAILKRFFLKTR